MGADRGILVHTDEENLQPLAVAKLLKAVVQKENPQVVLVGKQAIDDDASQTGQMLAGLLGWSQGTQASRVKFNDDGGTVDVTREVDAGLQTLRLKLPVVITCDLRLNEPVFAKLPEIMKAKKKPLEEYTPKDLGVDVKPRFDVVEVNEPPKRGGGKILQSVEELVEVLKKEGFVK